MVYNPYLHRRRTIRLPSYDYGSAGAYFVTLCTFGRECLFGEVVDGEMNPSPLGLSVGESWRWLAQRFPGVTLDHWVLMPNHLHGILVLGTDTSLGGSPKPLGRLIGAFKTVSTKQVNAMRQTPGSTLWQRNYWEHVVRNEADLERIRTYIEGNPGSWAADSLNLANPLRGRNDQVGRFANRPTDRNRHQKTESENAERTLSERTPALRRT